MKLTLATLLAGSLALFFSVSTLPHTDFSEYFFRLNLIFLILGVMLSICILPWLKGSFSEKWAMAVKYGVLLTFASFDLGYLVFSLSTLI